VYVVCKKNPRHKQRQGFHTIAAAQAPTAPHAAAAAAAAGLVRSVGAVPLACAQRLGSGLGWTSPLRIPTFFSRRR